MDVFRCGCGRGVDLKMEGREKTIECPHCGNKWKVEAARGYYRIYEWLD
jgi:DNA-directed RNA polymerase subunit RPC12/RpoP